MNISKRLILLVVFCFCGICFGADWPTYNGDNHRSGVSEEELVLPLRSVWVRHAIQEPVSSWPEMPARQDYWNNIAALSPTHTYDRAYHVAVAGGRLYYGSSGDDTVYCVDVVSGETLWSFITEGPVRLAPSVSGDKVYAGSDDGCVYCLSAKDGGVVWKYRGAADRRLAGNGRMISRWPVRCGVVVEDDMVYFSCGVFPKEGVYLCAVESQTGKEIWKKKIKVASQGYLLGSPSALFVPTGRTSPAAFDRSNGNEISIPKKRGGSFAVVLEDMLVHGPGERGNIHITEPATLEKIVSTPGRRLIAKGPMVYILGSKTLHALERTRYIEVNREIAAIEKIEKKKRSEQQNNRLVELGEQRKSCRKWQVDCPASYSMIMASDTLFVGGENQVLAYSAVDGACIWKGEVRGNAYGLAVSDGRLFVSTDDGAIYCFAAGGGDTERVVVSETVCELSPYSNGKEALDYKHAADTIVKNWVAGKGYCLVLGAGDGQLVYELAKRCDMRIIGVEKDVRKVAAARKLLGGTGLYGKQIVIHHVDTDRLPYQKYFANLIISDESSGGGWMSREAAEVLRVLRPGGTIAFGFARGDFDEGRLREWSGDCFADFQVRRDKEAVWGCWRRPMLKDTGEWTHLYADAANTNCSMETKVSNDMEVQWFGPPGPRKMVDRHHRSMSPLCKNGRLFVYGNERVIAVDAYNGVVLWEVEVPGSLRLGLMNDCGNMCVTEKYVFVAAKDECWCIDAVTGRRENIFKAPQLVDGQKSYWAYIATVDGQLFGSGEKDRSSFTSFGFQNDTVGQIEGDFRLKSTSDYLFSIGDNTGEELWVYRNGVILNSSVVIGGGRVFFVESRNAGVKEDSDGRVRLDDFLRHGAFLIGLDAKTGDKVFEQPLEVPFQHVMFTCCVDDTVVLTGSYNADEKVRYGLYGFSAGDGRLKWESGFTGGGIGSTHGRQWQHPSIVKGKIYLMPHIFDLETGAMQENGFERKGRGCGTITASATHLFYRGDNPTSYDIGKDKHVKMTNATRPGCWINIIPADGLVLIPESSSGCTCSYSLQTSLALIGED